jgi:hypothetical protein
MPLRVKNIERGFQDSQGRFHPIRASSDYDPIRAGDTLPSELKKKLARSGRKKATKKAAKKAVKKAAKKKVVARGAAKLAQRKMRKRNPIPVDRYIRAKVKRTRSGDIKIMIS